MAEAKFIKFEFKKSSAFVIVDLTGTYKKFAGKVTRGVAMVQERRAVLVQDEFEIENPCELVWGMTTDAQVSIKEKGVATLTLEGKELIARVLSPAGAEFVVESAEQKAPEKTNRGVRRLIVRLPQAKGSVRLAVLLSPAWKDGGAVKTAEMKPLEKW